jgi:serine/threonine protein kinase
MFTTCLVKKPKQPRDYFYYMQKSRSSFGKPFDISSDIWSWGMAVCFYCLTLLREYCADLDIQYFHILEAQADIKAAGMFDNTTTGALEEKTKTVQNSIAHAFVLREVPLFSHDEDSRNLLPDRPDIRPESDWWAEKLPQKGLSTEDIEFLFRVLNPNPQKRWTAEQIIRSGYLEVQTMIIIIE